MLHGLLAVDPGLTGTGWAWWRNIYTLAPTRVGVITVREPKAWWTRAALIAHQLTAIEAGYLVCEFPEYHESSGRQMGWRTGDLQKLTFLVGMIAGARDKSAAFYPVTPNAWKGQLPKHVVQHRIEEILGKEVCERLEIRTHAWDAVGIGLWFRLNRCSIKTLEAAREANKERNERTR